MLSFLYNDVIILTCNKITYIRFQIMNTFQGVRHFSAPMYQNLHQHCTNLFENSAKSANLYNIDPSFEKLDDVAIPASPCNIQVQLHPPNG